MRSCAWEGLGKAGVSERNFLRLPAPQPLLPSLSPLSGFLCLASDLFSWQP